MEQWQIDKFYAESSALGFIKYYFDVKDGVRCISAHPRDYPKKGRIQYEYKNNMQRMYTFYPELLTKYNCIHSFMHIFDTKVLDWIDQNDALDLYRSAEKGGRAAAGICGVLEIDSPYVSREKGAKRLDIMNFIPDLNVVIKKMGRILDDIGEEYNILFSGNGIYIILQGYYPRLDGDNIGNLYDYRQNFINLFKTMQKTELGDDLKIHVDNSKAPWNDYMKIPFTFHEWLPRISIPLSKKDDIVKDDLQFLSDAKNVMQNPHLVDEIIKRAAWEKLW